MKVKNILWSVAALALTLTMQSCLKDQEDLFDKAAPLRVQATLDKAQETLMASPDGWELDYYPDRSQQYGGYVYTLKFDSLLVDAGSEIQQGTHVTSNYKMSDEAGPVLAFDDYNDLLHYFAKPDINKFDAYDGDFEFIIDEVSDSLIAVRGLRTNNTMYLHRLSTSGDDYIAKVLAMQQGMTTGIICGGFEADLGGRHVKGMFDYDSRQFTYSLSGDTTATDVTTAFIFSDRGVRFYSPIPMGNGRIAEVAYDKDAFSFEGNTTSGAKLDMKALHTAGYIEYDDYAGQYALSTKELGNVDITLTPDGTGEGFTVSGLGKFNVHVDYNKSNGRLYWHGGQLLGTDSNGLPVYAYAMDEDGYVSIGKSLSLMTETLSENPLRLHWTTGDNFEYHEYFTYTGFRIYDLENDGLEDHLRETVDKANFYFGGKEQFINITEMTKK